jgi:hypothetical protein
MNISARFVLSAALLLCGDAAAATNIVQNPGFEQGDANWEAEDFSLGPSPLWAHTDPGMARLTYCSGAACLTTLNSGADIGQLLATAAGDSYDLSFWVRSFTGESRFSVFWDGALLEETGTPNGPMLQYRFSGLVASANATLLQLHGYNSLDQHMSFDDFSVVPVSGAAVQPAPEMAVAEPGAYALLLAGMVALVFVRRRRAG